MSQDNCRACDRELPPLRSRGRPRRWCSQSCRVWAHNHPGQRRPIDWLPNGRVARPECICRRCNQTFVPYDTRLLYCSSECFHADRAEHYAAARPARCVEPGCSNPLTTTAKRFRSRCSPCHRKRYPPDPAKVKAHQRRKTHIRKAKMRYADFTSALEQKMRAKAKRCPLCQVRLIDAPYLPASKELDHIVPLNVGGTHTHGNVRIICRLCNQRRPRDGSDYVGPVTLFALEVA